MFDDAPVWFWLGDPLGWCVMVAVLLFVFLVSCAMIWLWERFAE